jgi:hypothetical protein
LSIIICADPLPKYHVKFVAQALGQCNVNVSLSPDPDIDILFPVQFPEISSTKSSSVPVSCP